MVRVETNTRIIGWIASWVDDEVVVENLTIEQEGQKIEKVGTGNGSRQKELAG